MGETWYTAKEEGGKVQFWVQWLGIDPPYRRRGYATEALGWLEREARKLGSDRLLLTVWMDNPGAIALYSALGYTANNMNMVKRLSAPG